VRHPREWGTGGYHEIQAPPQRYQIVDREVLAEALGLADVSQLAPAHAEWIAAALARREAQREPEWTESLAVGRREFVERISAALADRARHRHVEAFGGAHVLRDPSDAYGPTLRAEMEPLDANRG
jgi:putative transposase